MCSSVIYSYIYLHQEKAKIKDEIRKQFTYLLLGKGKKMIKLRSKLRDMFYLVF